MSNEKVWAICGTICFVALLAAIVVESVLGPA